MKIKKILVGLMFGVSFTACNLDYTEYSSFDKSDMEQTYENVVGMVTNLYARITIDFGQYDGGMLASACDEAEYAYPSGKVCDFTNGAWSPVNSMATRWTANYYGIQMCNHYLTEFPGLTFEELKLNDDYRQQMFRYHNSFYEVRLMRAMLYFELARTYGDVPLFTDVMTVDKVNTLKRDPAQKVFDFVISECDEMYKKLPADYTKLGLDGMSPAETGRFTSYTALALKARAALYAASPLFNTSNDKALWERAVKANKDVLDKCTEGGFKLGKYNEIWGPKNYYASEVIFAKRIGDYSSIESRNYPMGVVGGHSGNCPTQNMVDAYEMKATGLAYNEAGSGYDEAKPYDGRDPRFYMTIVKNGDTKWPANNSKPIETFYGGLNAEPLAGATPTGYYLKKYLDGNIDFGSNSKYKKSKHNWVYFRLGEFYLNYAEAIFNLTGSAYDAGAYGMSAVDAVNVIRARAGVEMPAFPAGMSNDAFWKKYQNERMVELAFECHRFFDLRRWKEGDKLKNITEMKLTRNDDGSITYNRVVVDRIWDEKMYLFPIPQSERMKNSNLVQNPGW